MHAAGVAESTFAAVEWKKGEKKKKKEEKKKKKNQDPSSVLFQTDAYPNSGRVAEINLITWLVSITVIVPRFSTIW